MTDLPSKVYTRDRQNFSSTDIEQHSNTDMEIRTGSDIRNRDELRLGRTTSSQQLQQLSDNAPCGGIGSAGKIRTPRHWWNYGSLLLENKGSVARDHLASERTFLAWLRTSLGLASIGVGVTQLLKLSNSSDSDESHTVRQLNKSIGLLFIVGAMITLLIGTQRYFNVQGSLTRNVFPASKFGISFLLIFVFSGKVHGSLARAGKVKSQTPKVDKTEKPKQPRGRAYKRKLYTRRFVNVATTPGGKRKMNPGPSSKA